MSHFSSLLKLLRFKIFPNLKNFLQKSIRNSAPRPRTLKRKRISKFAFCGAAILVKGCVILNVDGQTMARQDAVLQDQRYLERSILGFARRHGDEIKGGWKGTKTVQTV